jgi:hypothetical protein
LALQREVWRREAIRRTFGCPESGRRTRRPAAAMAPVGELKFGYVNGAFDSIEEIVADLGYNVDQLTVAQLGESAVTDQYSIIFLNCGMDWPTAAAVANLRSFMEAGGLVYASDWSIEWAEELLPTDFLASDGNNDQGTYPASVVDSDVALWLGGQTSIQLTFNLGGWERVTSRSTRSQLLIQGTQGTLANQPLAVMVMPAEWNDGGLVYTSFHNAAQVTDEQERILEYFVFR